MALLTVEAAVGPQTAAAQCTAMPPTNCTRVTVDGKGIVGLGLIGAELGLIIPAIAGVRDEWWPYLVFPLIGAVGGAIGGWGVEEATRPENLEEVDVALLVGGMALLVPAIVGTLALTAYQPPEDSEDAEEGPFDDTVPADDTDSVDAVNTGDEGGGDEGGEFDDSAPAEGDAAPTSSAPSAPRSAPAAAMRELLAGGPGILRFDLFDGPRIIIAAPMPSGIPTYTASERAALRLAPSTDVVIPVISATF